MSVTATVDTCLTIDVAGVPAPQGSKSYKGMRNGRPILTESSKKVTPWRQQVETAARARMRLTRTVNFTGPLTGEAWFWLTPPLTIPPERIIAGNAWPITYPDLSKLIRSTEDALTTAGVIADDALFVDWNLHKRYSVNGTTGARIIIRPITATLL